jgi:acetyltransferase-like isoleucine patch superfamily enzyme
LTSIVRSIVTFVRWRLARRKATRFGRPRYLGRGFEVGRDVCIDEGAVIGHDVKIDGNITIGENADVGNGALLLGSIVMGANAVVGRQTYVGTGPEGHIAVGNNVFINDFSKIGAMKRLIIEDHCIFAAFLEITDAEHGTGADQYVQYAPITAEPVKIGEGVWLGSHVVVLKGASIGPRSVIGAHSLVKGEIASDCIAFGIPARVHQSRPEYS